jgi:hypothetical protein
MDTTGPVPPPKKTEGQPAEDQPQDGKPAEGDAPANDNPVPEGERPPVKEGEPSDVKTEEAKVEETKTEETPAETVDPADDWWDNFAKAVEDPNVGIYEYLRNNALQAMDLDNKENAPSAIVLAREAALKELFSLKDPEELSKKLASLESNVLLFNSIARAVMKVSRAVLDTYIKTRKEAKEGTTPEDMGAAIGANLKKELAGTEEELNPALASVARSLKDKDEKEVAVTLRKAAAQMGEERNVTAMMRDAATFARRYLKPDNIVNIAIIALPLITWQYRWALAIGLGAFAGRHSIRHGYNAARALYKGDRSEARVQGREALANLKSAGGSVLLIALTPALAKFPILAAGFLGFAAEAAYHKVIDTFNKMLAEEEKAPGSTPLGKRLKAGIKNFFSVNQDKLGALAAKTLKAVAPHAATDAVEALSKRLPFTKMRKVASRTWMLTGALTKRFNRIATAKAKEWRDDVADMGRDFMNAVEGALSDVVAASTQREAEMIAGELLMKERARAIAEEEARLAAEEEQKAYAEGADDGMRQDEDERVAEADNSIEEGATAGEDGMAAKKRRLAAIERTQQRADAERRAQTLKAKPS